jgi:hypothetical protein
MEFRISVEFQSCYGSDTMEGKQAMISKGDILFLTVGFIFMVGEFYSHWKQIKLASISVVCFKVAFPDHAAINHVIKKLWKKWNNKYIYLHYQMTKLHVFQTQPSLIRSTYNNDNKIMQWCAILSNLIETVVFKDYVDCMITKLTQTEVQIKYFVFSNFRLFYHKFQIL